MRNMMGLLGNVAEVKHLRQRLMVADYINVFNKLVHSCSDGIEVSVHCLVGRSVVILYSVISVNLKVKPLLSGLNGVDGISDRQHFAEKS